MRQSVVWERRFIGLMIALSWAALSLLHTLFLARWDHLQPLLDQPIVSAFLKLGLCLVPALLGDRLLRQDIWKFEKYHGKLRYRWNKDMTIPLPPVRAVKTWRRGRKFYLALDLAGDKAMKIGRFGYSRSEFAWSQDAERISRFLGVPLEISHN